MRAMIFDLDGTLVDTVYAHVFAWRRAFAEAGLAIDGWRIHRRIDMSGGLFTRAVTRELGRAIDAREAAALERRQGEVFRQFMPQRPPSSGRLSREGAFRVYRDAAELHRSLDELGLVP
jgi:beta-phosphoglucomutase-like phosphatase (HAD superfamily)